MTLRLPPTTKPALAKHMRPLVVSPLIKPITSAVSRAFTLPGQSAQAPASPTTPPPLPPAIQPTTKPAGKGMQSSFLSGVAGGAAGQGLSGSNTGKTLLGQ